MYSRNTSPDPKNFVRIMVIIHLALFMGQALFASLVVLESTHPTLDLKPVNDVFFYISPAMMLVGIFAGSFLFKQSVAKLSEKPTLDEKLRAYQTALITRYALSEAATMFSIVCMLLTNNLFYCIVAGIGVLYFIIIRPTKFKIQEDLGLGFEEQAETDAK